MLPIKQKTSIPTIQLGLLCISGIALVATATWVGLETLYSKPSGEIGVQTEIMPPGPFVGIELEARAAYVWDVRAQKALFALNEETQLPLASVTKLMTALAASELLAEDSVVTIQLNAIQQEGDSGFSLSERFKSGVLRDFTLLESSNDGAFALASAAHARLAGTGSEPDSFVAYMNELAVSLGLVQTYFVNPTGLDSSEYVGGGYGSARDMATLMEHLITKVPETVSATRQLSLTFSSLDLTPYKAENTNTHVGDIPGLIASKTGFTDLAGGNLIIAFDAGINHPLIIALLGSTEAGRFRDVEKLAAAAREAVKR
jgi:D-alanyl-D-alanine carboxypeptidase